jgi:hypothetical protein
MGNPGKRRPVSDGVELAHDPLSRTRRGSFLFLAVYFPAVVLGHDVVQKAVHSLQDRLPSIVYTTLINGSAFATFALATMFVVRRTKDGRDRGQALAYWFGTMVLIAVTYYYLVAVGTEMIHLLQYALLAPPLFAITRRFGETFLWATMLAAVDEGYQFFVLRIEWDVYFDFNDVLLNQLGVAVSLVGLFCLGARNAPRARRRRPAVLESPALLTLFALLAGCVILYWMGRLQLYPMRESVEPWILLNRAEPGPAFWQHPAWASKRFHALRPLAGLAVVLTIPALYLPLGHRAPNGSSSPSTL